MGLPARLRTPEMQRLLRYSLVSVVAIIVGQTVLGFCFGLLNMSARGANVVATAAGTVPSYVLNRRWTWGGTGRSHLWREVVPFWVLAFIGFAFSTWAVGLGESWVRGHDVSRGAETAVVMGASLGAYGVLWVGKFVILNKVLFAHHLEDLPQAIDGRTGLPT